ncbi:uncharacterized protein EDB91DRAFT_1250406 [Suillus paluster]|uniref:uncharacterized protein n=1 Tax=Suillus paluster TaxID=48578 RepID=UPI001B882D6D|nr:uncharacterized protein EDB91DRAFT_1250406 [Suillus paluster]KAG1735574.1 hypothetical protein EDB91DRAFT_1250406 [Suillus paluster]
MSTRRVTRAKNATQHPGIPDITPKKKHRTAAEVAAERQSQLDAKEEKERTKRASIKHIAKYEKKQADQDVVTDATPQAVPSKPKPKPIPSKRKAVVAPPAVEDMPRPIPRKKKVIVHTSAVEDNGFLLDAEMDDVVADSSTFNPDPTQPSDTMASDLDTDGSDSAMPSSPPRKKMKVSGKKAGKVTKSSVRDAIKAVQQTHMSEKSKAADRKKTAPHSTISLHTNDSNDPDDSDPDDDAMVVDQPSMKASKKATSKKSARSVPAARLNNDPDEPITNPPLERQPSQEGEGEEKEEKEKEKKGGRRKEKEKEEKEKGEGEGEERRKEKEKEKEKEEEGEGKKEKEGSK